MNPDFTPFINEALSIAYFETAKERDAFYSELEKLKPTGNTEVLYYNIEHKAPKPLNPLKFKRNMVFTKGKARAYNNHKYKMRLLRKLKQRIKELEK